MRLTKTLVFLLVCSAFILPAPRTEFVEYAPWPCAIVIHESASTFGDVELIRKWHLERGWSDIGYHAVVLNGRRTVNSRYDPALDGKIEFGRSEDLQGFHCLANDMNYYALGVCLIGVPGKRGYPTRHQLDALVRYCAAQCLRYAIPVPMITQHSDHEPLKPRCASLDMDEIRDRVRAEMRRSRTASR